MTPRFHFKHPVHDMRAIAKEFADIRPFGGAALIYADPPWRHVDWSDEGDKSKTPGHHYETQPIEWIEQLPVHVLAAHDSLLWLWTTAPMLQPALGVVEAWGFTYKTNGSWLKRTKGGKVGFGPGRRLRTSHEPFILATKGRPRVAQAIRSSVVTGDHDEDPFASLGVTIEAIAREHSRKPDEAIAAARMCVDGPAVELFARQRRDGWAAWGSQVDKFSEAAE